jgi:hypothetical protein
MGRQQGPDLTNEVFGRLRVLYQTEHIGKHMAFVCECECGKFPTVRASCLLHGYTKSCGCLRTELARTQAVQHGSSYTPEYVAWQHARRAHPGVPSFADFYKSVGPKQSFHTRLQRTSEGVFQWTI